MFEREDLIVGHVYSMKVKRNCGGWLNDKQIRWIGADYVQLDSPSVKPGQNYQNVKIDKFLKQIEADITDIMPRNEWREYPNK